MALPHLIIFLALILTRSFFSIAQESNFPLKLTIEDTLLVKGENEDVVRIHIKLEKLESIAEHLLLPFFNKYVPLPPSCDDTTEMLRYDSWGLAAFIQDSSGRFKSILPALVSRGYSGGEDRYHTVTIVDDSSLKFDHLTLSDSALYVFELAKLTFPPNDTSVEMVVYPLLERDFHASLGTYYLTLVYNFKEFPYYYTEDDLQEFRGENVFKGVLKSNTVKLIVKEPLKKSKRKRN